MGNLRSGFPERGGYPHNIWARSDGVSGAGYFSIGYASVRAGIWWWYPGRRRHARRPAPSRRTGSVGLDVHGQRPRHGRSARGGVLRRHEPMGFTFATEEEFPTVLRRWLNNPPPVEPSEKERDIYAAAFMPHLERGD